MATIIPFLESSFRDISRLMEQATEGARTIDRFLRLRQRERQALARLLGDDKEDKRAAASELAAITWNRHLLSPKPSDPAVWRAARREALDRGIKPRDFVSQNLTLGFLEASREAAEKQFVRIGASWKKDKRGRRRIAPCTLPQSELIAWLRARAFRHLSVLIGRVGPEDSPRHERTAEHLDVRRMTSLEAGRLLDTSQTAKKAISLLATAKLTQRERRVLELTADGLNSKEIAKKLRINPSTVRQYRRRARQKLDSL